MVTVQDDADSLSDDEDDYPHLFRSIRSPTGLEVGVKVTWPGVAPIELSTCLPSEQIAPMFHGTQWAGTRVWKAAIVALQYLLNDKGPLKQEQADDFSCLELGCGLGVPGMILSRIFPKSRVVLTDCDALLPQLEQNLAANNFNVTAAALDWEDDEALVQLLQNVQLEAFDVVLNCDCIYEPLYGESWKALLKVQVQLLQRRPNALVLTALERRKFDGANQYFDSLKEHSAVVSKVELVHQEDPVEIYRIYGVVS